MNLLPARYGKALAALVAALITYSEAYGATWHLVPALIAIGGILGVYGVPNAAPTAAGSPKATPPQQTTPPPGQAPTAG